MRDIRCKYRTGQIVPMWGTPAEYDYLLLCDGSQISAELYPELVAVLGGNTLPDLVGRFLEGAGSAGEYKEAGLPDIYGFLQAWGDRGAAFQQGGGAFVISDKGITCYPSDAKYRDMTYRQYPFTDFYASRSNPIYGSSTTVQPKSMTVKYYICYAG